MSDIDKPPRASKRKSKLPRSTYQKLPGQDELPLTGGSGEAPPRPPRPARRKRKWSRLETLRARFARRDSIDIVDTDIVTTAMQRAELGCPEAIAFLNGEIELESDQPIPDPREEGTP
jgi:hypothetical protein